MAWLPVLAPMKVRLAPLTPPSSCSFDYFLTSLCVRVLLDCSLCVCVAFPSSNARPLSSIPLHFWFLWYPFDNNIISCSRWHWPCLSTYPVLTPISYHVPSITSSDMFSPNPIVPSPQIDRERKACEAQFRLRTHNPNWIKWYLAFCAGFSFVLVNFALWPYGIRAVNRISLE